MTALHLAAYKGHAKVVDVICQVVPFEELGVNEMAINGTSPLHTTAWQGHV